MIICNQSWPAEAEDADADDDGGHGESDDSNDTDRHHYTTDAHNAHQHAQEPWGARSMHSLWSAAYLYNTLYKTCTPSLQEIESLQQIRKCIATTNRPTRSKFDRHSD